MYERFLKSTGVSTDSRTLQAGQMFFALRGPNFDGNAYIKQALKAGAAYVVADSPEQAPKDKKVILVEDSLKALQALANEHRRRLSATKFLAVTGSNGKTTTKELLAAVLGAGFKTFVTPGNLNNHIGLPLSILRIEAGTEIAVLEMGDNHPGEIAELCAIAEPDYGLVTNIGIDHIGHYNGLEENAQTKFELFDYLKTKNHAVAFVNRGDEWSRKYDFENLKTVGYNGELPNELVGCILNDPKITALFPEEQAQWVVHNTAQYSHLFVSSLIGRHNLENVLAAVAVGRYFKINSRKLFKAIRGYKPQNNRSQWVKRGDWRILLDAYNANPTSMEAAIETVFAQPNARVALVLGDMLELGAESEKYHKALGKFINQYKPTVVVGIGLEIKNALKRVQVCPAHHYLDVKTAAPYIAEHLRGANLVLFKGSRGIAVEKLLDALSN